MIGKITQAVINRTKRIVGYYILYQSKNLFLDEDPKLKALLIKYNFHPSISAHPRILFHPTEKEEGRKSNVIFLDLKISILRGILASTTMSCSQSKEKLAQLGINEYYSRSTDLCLANDCDDYRPYPTNINDNKNKKVAVYTVITGDYDNLHDPIYTDSLTDYYLFTNNPKLSSKTWNVIQINEKTNDLLLSRKVKLFPNRYLDKRYDTSIYIDASFIITGPLRELAYYLDDQTSIILTRHRERKTVYEELLVLESSNRYSDEEKNNMHKQYNNYVALGFTDNLGLTENGIIVRKHHDISLLKLMESWWVELQKGIIRDQLTLMPAIQINHFTNYKVLDANISNNQYAILVGHK